MSFLPYGLAQVAVVAGTVLIPGARPVPIGPQPSHHVTYTPLDKEFYLAADQAGYVRPGLQVAIVSITNVSPPVSPTDH